MPVARPAGADPYRNLAVEEAVLNRTARLSAAGDPPASPRLLVYRNGACVVIGRHQNPWVECNLRLMRERGVPLVRRASGGGAVYHDEGNTNYCFIAAADGYDQRRQFGVVLAALRRLGVEARTGGRSDLFVGDRKVSGNAFRHVRGASLHHGTLLVDADLDALLAFLAPRAAAIETRATASVRSRVMNLREALPGLDHEALAAALEAAFAEEYGERDGLVLRTEAAVTDADGAEIAARAAELASWEWVYGHTPAFTRTLSVGPPSRAGRPARGGHLEARLSVRNGVIEEAAVEGEPGFAQALRAALVGVRHGAREFEERARAGDLGPRVAEAMRLLAREME